MRLYFDPTYILVILAALLSMAVSGYMKSVFAKFERIGCTAGLTGAEAAAQVLRCSGIYDVRIAHVSGQLTDHYDPAAKTVNLSDSVYGRSSLAAICVAAHECGHAIQHDRGYVPLNLRSAIVPAANFGSQLSWPIFILGLILGLRPLLLIGIVFFLFALCFQLVTLPVEFNASSRAIAVLRDTGMISGSEVSGARKVLRAAALTYVAAVLSSLLQLLRLVILANGNSNRRRR